MNGKVTCSGTGQRSGTAVACSKCNGSGLLACNDKWAWGVNVCDACNGYGNVVLLNKKPVKFDVDRSEQIARARRMQ